MSKVVKEHINFNTVLLLIVGALVTLGVKKADAAFTEITRLQAQQEDLARRVANTESVLGIFVPRRKQIQNPTTP